MWERVEGIGKVAVMMGLVGTVGCISTAPASFSAVTPEPIESAYACALRRVNELGYTVTSTTKEAGFITADKQTSGAGTMFLSGEAFKDQLTVSIFGADSARRIRVSTAQRSEKSTGFSNATKAFAPSERGKRDAQAVLSSCATGAIAAEPGGFSAAAP